MVEEAGKKYDQDKPRVLFPLNVYKVLFNDDFKHYTKSAAKDIIELNFGGRGWRTVAVAAAEEVMQHGAHKYGVDNWQRLEDFERRYYEASVRHTAKVFNVGGEQFPKDDVLHGLLLDADSGMPHWKHQVCNLMFLLWKDLTKIKEKKK